MFTHHQSRQGTESRSQLVSTSRRPSTISGQDGASFRAGRTPHMRPKRNEKCCCCCCCWPARSVNARSAYADSIGIYSVSCASHAENTTATGDSGCPLFTFLYVAETSVFTVLRGAYMRKTPAFTVFRVVGQSIHARTMITSVLPVRAIGQG